MGNYVVQKPMAAAWTRKNQPLLVNLINQLVIVAADVDSDLFGDGAPDNNDGNAVANLTYRITALYSRRDSVLSASAGLKHFGMRRVGRTGLSSRAPWQIQRRRRITCGTSIVPAFSHDCTNSEMDVVKIL
jgi:esterase/lipase superfamily enzyme